VRGTEGTVEKKRRTQIYINKNDHVIKIILKQLIIIVTDDLREYIPRAGIVTFARTACAMSYTLRRCVCVGVRANACTRV